MRLSVLYLALLLAAGCGARPARESIPYRFRQSMLTAADDGDESFVESRRKPARRPRTRTRTRTRPTPKATTTCWRLRGRTFDGPREAATIALLRACLGPGLPAAAAKGRGLTLHRRAPGPGDLVLFHDTRDANNNRRVDDRFTDAGVVLEVKRARVRFLYLHPRSGAAVVGTLNLHQPNRRRLGGKAVQNTFLRVKRRGDPPATRYLAGQLLAGFARVAPAHSGRL